MDTIIIGAGPTGISCALSLARTGLSVGLVNHGLKKPNTMELISGRAKRLLEDLVGKSLLDIAVGIEIDEIVSLWGSPEPVISNAMFNPWGRGIAVERGSFDKALLETARKQGITIFSNTSAIKIDRIKNGWNLVLRGPKSTISLQSKFVILATGKLQTGLLERGSVIRCSGLALMTRLQIKESKSRNCHALFVEATDKGWWYSLPDNQDSLFVGFCTHPKYLRQSFLRPQKLFFHELNRTELISSLVNTTTVTTLYSKFAGIQIFEKVAGDRWLAAGDAAFTPYPLSGMGIEFGIESALRGSLLLASSLESPSTMEYEKWVRNYSLRHNQALTYYLNVADILEGTGI